MRPSSSLSQGSPSPCPSSSAVPYDLGAEFLYNARINAQQHTLWEGKAIPCLVWMKHKKLALWLIWPDAATYFQQERGEGV